MSPALLTISKWGSAALTASPVATAPGGDRMDDSTPSPPQDHDREDEYAALIKPGDAVETPDGEIWVVAAVLEKDLDVMSAYRDATGLIYADAYEPTRTIIPAELARKVADARQVRRP